MALKLPWKYKSLIAVVNSYRDGEEDINRAEQNNFAVTGSFESFHPLTFFHFFPSATGRGSGRVEGRRMVQNTSKFPQQSKLFAFFLFLLAPLFPIYSSSLSLSIGPFILQPILLRLPLQVQINWCSSDASACWTLFQGIYWSSGPAPLPSLSLSMSHSLSQ